MWVTAEKCPRIEVNEMGKVRYKDSGKIASTSIAATGYVQVGVWYNGKPRTYNVHRLVAEAFLPNPDGLPEVNHKDENRANCRLENLEWCTSKYNTNYGACIEKLRHYCCKPVVAIDKQTGEETIYYSLAEAGRQLSINPSRISRVLRGGRSGTANHYWRYAEEVS